MRAMVVGSGVAGLSIAELLVRNDWQVTLVERSDELGGDASRRTQDWWHTGWLYAGLPDPSATNGCIRSIEWAQTLYADRWHAWLIGEQMLFAYAVDTFDLNVVSKPLWRTWVTVGPLRRMRGYGRAGIEVTPPPALAELMCRWEDGADGASRYRTIRTTDRGIDTARVLKYLAGHLGEADVIVGAKVELQQSRRGTKVKVNGLTYDPDLVVLAAGSGTSALLEPVNPGVGRGFTSLMSPIAVMPLQPWPSFIRYTPNLAKTVNHVAYPINGIAVSTVGANDELRPGDDASPFFDKIGAMLPLPTSSLQFYLGTKTEYTRGRGRRWNHAIVPFSPNGVACVAGKFSQFPLLVGEFAEAYRLRVDRPSRNGGQTYLVGPTEPERLCAASMLDAVRS
jgi:glycine/D-amino acid oxidase-like deaminating enzyme